MFETISNWVGELKCCRTSKKMNIVLDALWKCQPPKMIDNILDIVLSARRIKVRDIGKAKGISKCTMALILRENLGVKKISARLVPRFLTLENKRNRVVNSKAVLGFSFAILRILRINS